MSANGANPVEMVKDAIYRTCLHLDDQEWNAWLDMCDESFEYKITSYSPEIKYDMTYFSGDRDEMRKMLEMLPKHNSDHSPFKRHAVVYTVDLDDKGKSAKAVTSVVIFQNMLDGMNSHVDSGENRLFCAGRYIDTFSINGKGAKLTSREVRLETRRLDKGTHWPL